MRHIGTHSADHVVAVLAPMSGSAGIWGPSCISCARMAVDEVNDADGVGGQKLVPYFLNADDSNIVALESEIDNLLNEGAIKAIIGMNLSSVRQRLTRLVRGRIPYVYTPAYEGFETSRNVFAIGETTADLLAPTIRHLTEKLKVRRWALIGNEYVWPRSSHQFACSCIRACGGSVVVNRFVPLGLDDAHALADQVAQARPDILLISLIGQDSVAFNRAFGALDLDRKIFRLSTAIDENILLALEGKNARRLFTASGYFSELKTDANLAFKERYVAYHKTVPPVLNALGQSLYKGVHFYAAMQGGDRHRPDGTRTSATEPHPGQAKSHSIYISRADGHRFEILDDLS